MGENFSWIKQYLEDDEIVSGLKEIYGDVVINDIIEYFNNPFVSAYNTEKFLTDNLESFLKDLRVLNAQKGESFHKKTKNEEDYVDLDIPHHFGENYSNEIFSYILGEQFRKNHDEFVKLEEKFMNIGRKKLFMIREFEFKKSICERLKKEQEDLGNLSFGKDGSIISILDEKIREYDFEISRLSSEIFCDDLFGEHLTTKIKNTIRENQFNKLKRKRISMCEFQRMICNHKLVSYYRKLKKDVRRESVVTADSSYRVERDNGIDSKKKIHWDRMKANSSYSDDENAKANYFIFGVSYVRYGILEMYSSYLKGKDGVIDGFRRLPDGIANIFRERNENGKKR